MDLNWQQVPIIILVFKCKRMKFSGFIAVLLVVGCSTKTEEINYIDNTGRYSVKMMIGEKNTVKDTLVTFTDSLSGEVKAAGFYRNGVKSDRWRYNLPDSVLTIDWVDYADPYLPFQTNMISYVDSIKYGPDFSKFLIRQGEVDFVVTVAVNGALKNELKKESYLNLLSRDVAKNGLFCYSLGYISFKGETADSVRVQKIQVSSRTGDQERYLIVGYTFIDSGELVEIIMSAPVYGRQQADILFSGVFTGFRFKGRTLYNPFKITANGG